MHSVSVPTLKKYLAMSGEEVERLSERHIQNRNKNTIIGPYLNIIYKMLRDGFKGDFIYSYILHTGYKGKPSTMIDIIKCIARHYLKKDCGTLIGYVRVSTCGQNLDALGLFGYGNHRMTS